MMKKILFINFPVHGHVNPQFKLCKALSEENIELTYLTLDDFFPKFQDVQSINLVAYPENYKKLFSKLQQDITLHENFMGLMLVFHLLALEVIDFTSDLIDEIHPDLIICDTLALHGRILVEAKATPYILFFSSFITDSSSMRNEPALRKAFIDSIIRGSKFLPGILEKRYKLYKSYGKALGSMSGIMSPGEKFSIVNGSREFQPSGKLIKSNVHFAQPQLFEVPAVLSKNKILISVGTISFSEKFWDICMDAVEGLPYEVIMTMGNNPLNKINRKSIPDNVKIVDFLPLEEFRKVLSESILFISHGGMNSVIDSIICETPLLICPITAEQESNGVYIEQKRYGKLYKGTISSKKLKKSIIETINQRDDFIVPLRETKQSFIEAETMEEIIDALDEIYNIL